MVISGYENQKCKECGQLGHWSIHRVCAAEHQAAQRLHSTQPVEHDPPGTVEEPDWEAEATNAMQEDNTECEEAEDFFARVALLSDAYNHPGEEDDEEVEVDEQNERFVRVVDGDDDYHSSYYATEADQYNALFAVMEITDEEDTLTDNVEYSGIRFGAVSDSAPQKEQQVQQSTLIRPVRTPDENRPLVILTKINGFLALTLVDSACTTDAVSPDFARVSGLGVEALEKEIPLQLGTAGSRSVINRGAYASWEIGHRYIVENYFDVINIDRYDAIIGTIAMRKYNIVPVLLEEALLVGGLDNGTLYECLDEKEERAVVARRYAIRQSTRSQKTKQE